MAFLCLACGSAEPSVLAKVEQDAAGGSGGSAGVAGTGGTGSTLGHDAGLGGAPDAQADSRKQDSEVPVPDGGLPEASPDGDSAPPCEGEVGDSIQELNAAVAGWCEHPDGFPDQWCCERSPRGEPADLPIWTRPLMCGEEGEAYTSWVATDGPVQLPDGGLVECPGGAMLLQSLKVIRRCCE